MHTHVHTAGNMDVKCWISPSKCLRAAVLHNWHYLYRSALMSWAWSHAFMPVGMNGFLRSIPAVSHTRGREDRGTGVGFQIKASSPWVLPFQALETAEGDRCPQWVEFQAELMKKDTPLGQKHHDHSNWEGTCPSDFWVDFECSLWKTKYGIFDN